MELGGLTDEDFYSLRVDILFYDRDLLNNNLLRDQMLSFLSDYMGERGEWKKLSELYKTPITNPDYHVNALMNDLETQGYFFGKGVSYRDGEPIGIYLDQPITIEYKESPGSFSKLFPFRLLQVCIENRKWMQPTSAVERLGALLEFHLTNSFDNNLNKYRGFLLSLPTASGYIVRDFMDAIKLWLDSHQQKKQSKNLMKSPKTIAYALKFYQSSHRLIETDKELYTQFSIKYGSTAESIKNNLSRINREKQSIVFHTQNIPFIKEAIKILNDRKSKDEGRKLLKSIDK